MRCYSNFFRCRAFSVFRESFTIEFPTTWTCNVRDCRAQVVEEKSIFLFFERFFLLSSPIVPTMVAANERLIYSALRVTQHGLDLHRTTFSPVRCIDAYVKRSRLSALFIVVQQLMWIH